ncbi:hypothetical protein TRICI_000539 [Trichomonascus ciferrii]|uniref:Uncharacterized protein n=1 Tax=Trichomonascus ciferrii TaxID=44093 RepID=A0A642VD48_9ASCO|nr:hypothetical protein TRICI_000539 [Trichomonascus ciferrii]
MEYSKVCIGYILNRQVVVSSIEHIQYDIAYGACENPKVRQQLQRKLTSITPVKRTAVLQKDFLVLFKGAKTHSEAVYHFKGQETNQWALITHELSHGKTRYALTLVRKKATAKSPPETHYHHRWKLFKKPHHHQHQGCETIDPLPIVAKTSSLPLIDQPATTLESLVLLFETRVHRRLWKDRVAVCIGSRPADTSHASTLFGSDFPNFYTKQQQHPPPPLPSVAKYLPNNTTTTTTTTINNKNSHNYSNGNNNTNNSYNNGNTKKLLPSASNVKMRGKTKLEDILESPGEVSAKMRKDQRRRDLERITSVKLNRHHSKHSSYKSAYTSLPNDDNTQTAPSPSTSTETFESPMTEFPTTPPQSPKQQAPTSPHTPTPKSPNSGKVVISTPQKPPLSFCGEIIDSSSSHEDEKTLVPPLNDQRNLFRHVPPLYVQNKTSATDNRKPTRLRSMEALVNESEEIKAMLDTVYKGKLPEWHVLNGPIYPNPPPFDLPSPPNTDT